MRSEKEKFFREVIAYLFIIFLIIIPLILKIKHLLRNFNTNHSIDLENGSSSRSSELTLWVPENGGVE
ncbi:unnamed protein product [Chironomus riparius]|uniref:Uncharacterized protein n=1 Tax=Chironomus riparius TaxID=315576 RepID=A0A9N9WZ97_9DIPT|nr:unnamed protein product [Chironomus riparius]